MSNNLFQGFWAVAFPTLGAVDWRVAGLVTSALSEPRRYGLRLGQRRKPDGDMRGPSLHSLSIGYDSHRLRRLYDYEAFHRTCR